MAAKSYTPILVAAGVVALVLLLDGEADADAPAPSRARRLARGGAGLGAGRLADVERVRGGGLSDPTATRRQGGGDLMRGGAFGGAALEAAGAEFRQGRYVARDDRRGAMDARIPSVYHLNGLVLTPSGLRPEAALLPRGRPDPPVPARWIGGAAIDGGGLVTEGGAPAWRPVNGDATDWLVPWCPAADVPGVQGGERAMVAAFPSSEIGPGLMVPWCRVQGASAGIRTGIDVREGDPQDRPGFVSETSWIGRPTPNFTGIYTEGGETFISQLGFVQYDSAGKRATLRRYIYDEAMGRKYYLDGMSYSRTLAKLDRNREDVRALLYSHGTERGIGDPNSPLSLPIQPGPMPLEYMGDPSRWPRTWKYLHMGRNGYPREFSDVLGLTSGPRMKTYDRRALNGYVRDITYKRAAYWFRRLMGGRANAYAPASLVELVETAAETRRRGQQSFREVRPAGASFFVGGGR